MGAAGAGSLLDEGVEAIGVAGAVELLLALDVVIEMLDGTFCCPLKVLLCLMLSKFCIFLVKL